MLRFWFVAMFIMLLIGEAAPTWVPEVEPKPLLMISVLVAILFFAKLWMLQIALTLDDGELSHQHANSLWHKGMNIGRVFGAILIVAAVPWSGFSSAIASASAYGETASALMALLPLVGLALLSDCLDHQWEAYLDDQVIRSPRDNQLRLVDRPLNFLFDRAKKGWLLPLSLISFSNFGYDLLSRGLGGLTWIVPSEYLANFLSEDTFLGSLVITLSISIATSMLVCWLAVWIWTEKWQGDTKQYQVWLTLFERAGVKVQEIRIWNSGDRISIALLVGLIPWQRYVILSDRLLRTLSPRELEMVLLHEAAHVHRWHGPIRFSAVLLVASLAIVIGKLFLPISTTGALWGIDMPIALWLLRMTLGLLLGIFAAWGLRWLWHRTEIDADLTACRLSRRCLSYVTETETRDPESSLPASSPLQWEATMRRSAMVLCAALHNLVGSSIRAKRATWTHPSVRLRVEKLTETFGISGKSGH
jgi:Zn-dependent protease with chaperone function